MNFLNVDSFLNKYFNPIKDCYIEHRSIDFLSKEEIGHIVYTISKNFLPYPRYYYLKIPYKCIIENENNFSYKRHTHNGQCEDYLIVKRIAISKQYANQTINLKFSKRIDNKKINAIIKINDIQNHSVLSDFEEIKSIQISNTSDINIQNYILSQTLRTPYFSSMDQIVIKTVPDFLSEFSIVSKGNFGKISKEKGNIVTLKNIIELEWIIDLEPFETKKFDIFFKLKNEFEEAI